MAKAETHRNKISLNRKIHLLRTFHISICLTSDNILWMSANCRVKPQIEVTVNEGSHLKTLRSVFSVWDGANGQALMDDVKSEFSSS